MNIKLIIVLFSICLCSYGALKAQPTYLFFYSSTANEGAEKEVAVTEVITDTVKTHYLFKLLNLKKQSEEEMKNSFENHEEFINVNTDFSLNKSEAAAKRNKLLAEWKRQNFIIHHLKINYVNATGKEYPDY